LPADAPVELEVLGPVLVPRPHELRMPLDLVAGVQQLALAVQDPHEPLPGGDELQGPVALLVELDRMLDRLGLTLQRRPPVPGRRPRRIAELLDDRLLRLLHRASR